MCDLLKISNTGRGKGDGVLILRRDGAFAIT